jgi:hypothetical protein
MEPWIAGLIFLGVMILVIIIAVVLLVISGSGKSVSRKIGVIDLSRYIEQKDFDILTAHKDMFTGEWRHPTEDSKTDYFLEKGLMKKPKHFLTREDCIELTNKRGMTLILNGISAITKVLNKKMSKIIYDLEKSKSENSELKAEIIKLRKHPDKETKKIIDTAHKINPFIKQDKKIGK